MEALVAGRVVNQIKVDDQVALQAKVALERMLALP
jgi:quinolinate synthase